MARYDFFRRTADSLGAQRIATAHHAADQAETVLLNLVRGTGMQGLAGIPPVRGRIVRPLLETSRDDIETYLKTHGLSHVEDETNRDTSLGRNRLRREVMPGLLSLHPGAAASICRTAELLRREDAFLDSLAAAYLPQEGLSASRERLLSAPEGLRALRLLAGRLPVGKKGLHRRPLPGYGGASGGRRHDGAARRSYGPVPERKADPAAAGAAPGAHAPGAGGEFLGRIHNFRPENHGKFFTKKGCNPAEL